MRSDDVRGGRPRVAGTGVTIRRIVGWYRQGLTPEEITTEVPRLSLAEVYAALIYYHVNREEIEADIAAEDAEAKQKVLDVTGGKGVTVVVNVTGGGQDHRGRLDRGRR